MLKLERLGKQGLLFPVREDSLVVPDRTIGEFLFFRAIPHK